MLFKSKLQGVNETSMLLMGPRITALYVWHPPNVELVCFSICLLQTIELLFCLKPCHLADTLSQSNPVILGNRKNNHMWTTTTN